MKRSTINLGLFAILAGAAASSAKADWTNNFTAAEPFPPTWTLRGVGTDTEAANSNAMQLITQVSGLSQVGLLGSVPAINPGASTVLALATTNSGVVTNNYTIGAVVNPDLATQASRLGVLARWDDINRNGIACVVDYAAGELRIARYDDIARTFSQITSSPISNFAANKSYRVVAVAQDTGINVTVVDIAAGNTNVSAASATITPNLSGIAGIFVRADSVTTPVSGTYARAFFEPVARRRDVTGNGAADVLWTNGTTNEMWSWDFDSAGALSGAASLGAIPAGFEVRGTGDFNEDGRADLVYNNRTTGQSGIWLASSTGFTNIATQTLDPAIWEIVGVGELTEDGIPDIIWRDRTNDVLWVWEMNRGRVASATPFFAVPSGWSVQAVGDFNLDGDEDLVFRNADGRNGVLGLSDLTPSSWEDLPTVAGDWRIFGCADVDGNNRNDLFWRNETTGDQGVWFMDGPAIVSYTPIATIGTPWRPAN